MGRRDKIIASSIVATLMTKTEDKSMIDRVPGYFSLHWIDFERVEPGLFAELREEWQIKDTDYMASFHSDGESGLRSLGDMGFSGSTFFATEDSAYLIKSVPRRFEYSFFKDDLLRPYAEHMQKNVASLLVRITDFLQPKQSTMGTTIGTAPSHHIIMENIKYGQEKDQGKDNGKDIGWETYDLKPMSYFYPERDVADGAFATDEALSKLADEFNDKLILSLDVAEEYKAQLEKDTALLARANAVDYSLFLVRIPAQAAEAGKDSPDPKEPLPPAQPPFVPPDPPNWRTGIKSADGQWLYRASILDFFWAKHKTTAKLMTGLIKSYNLVVEKQGPMSITTDSAEYRARFLKMCKDMIEIRD